MNKLLGVGIYSPKEAEQLINVKQSDITRWIFGVGSSSPLWDSQLMNLDVKCIGFHDLLELRVVNHLKFKGISLQAIRRAIEFAKETYSDEHPLITRRFMTDGKSVFSEVAKRTEDSELLDLLKKQYVFKEVVEKAFYAGIDYDNSGQALRWFPSKAKFKDVVLDPDYSFGKPIIAGTAIKTSTLYEAFCAENKNSAFVARLFNVSPSAVKMATLYEEHLTRGLAA